MHRMPEKEVLIQTPLALGCILEEDQCTPKSTC